MLQMVCLKLFYYEVIVSYYDVKLSLSKSVYYDVIVSYKKFV